MNGYHYDSMLLISQNYGLHEETIKDAGIYQRQKIEILTPEKVQCYVRYAVTFSSLKYLTIWHFSGQHLS